MEQTLRSRDEASPTWKMLAKLPLIGGVFFAIYMILSLIEITAEESNKMF